MRDRSADRFGIETMDLEAAIARALDRDPTEARLGDTIDFWRVTGVTAVDICSWQPR